MERITDELSPEMQRRWCERQALMAATQREEQTARIQYRVDPIMVQPGVYTVPAFATWTITPPDEGVLNASLRPEVRNDYNI